MVTYPTDWTPMQLRDIGYIQMCRRIFQSQTKAYGAIPFYKISTFGGKADAYISQELYEKYKMLYPYPDKGDVLISAAGTVGKTVIFDGKDSYFQDSNIVWLKVDKEVIDRKFLWWFYRSFPWDVLEGTTIQRLYNSIILDTEIHLPEKPEQEEIARTLSQFDTYIDDLAELIGKKKGIREGALAGLLSGKNRLAGFDGEWIEVPLRSVLREKIKIGPFGSQLKKETLVRSGEYKVYGQENVYKKDFSIGDRFLSPAHFERLSTCEIKGGDFLMSTMGTIGKCAIAPMNLQKGIMDSHLIRFRINEKKLLPTYLLQLFSDDYTYLSNQTTKLAVGGIMDGLSVGIAQQLTVYMPEDLREQEAIVNVLTAMDEEIKALETERNKIIQIREGAMDDLMTGRVRLAK